MEGSALEASPEICSAAFQLGEVAGGCPGLGSAGGPHVASAAHLVGSWGGLTQRRRCSLPETKVKSGPAWGSTPATRSRGTGRLAFPRHGTSVGSTERLVLLLKFFSGRLLASVSGQAAGGWHSSGCASLGDSVFAVVRAQVSMPSALLAPRLCPNEQRRALAVPSPT